MVKKPSHDAFPVMRIRGGGGGEYIGLHGIREKPILTHGIYSRELKILRKRNKIYHNI
jgi:hypothetical protein